mmetsp:Transcript_5003/g.11983  ORF Transcript_5003/g.11983 Transcript_5003/m.11983 type:complete len:444 (+) Transcript_5003:1117-2448(+)
MGVPQDVLDQLLLLLCLRDHRIADHLHERVHRNELAGRGPRGLASLRLHSHRTCRGTPRSGELGVLRGGASCRVCRFVRPDWPRHHAHPVVRRGADLQLPSRGDPRRCPRCFRRRRWPVRHRHRSAILLRARGPRIRSRLHRPSGLPRRRYRIRHPGGWRPGHGWRGRRAWGDGAAVHRGAASLGDRPHILDRVRDPRELCCHRWHPRACGACEGHACDVRQRFHGEHRKLGRLDDPFCGRSRRLRAVLHRRADHPRNRARDADSCGRDLPAAAPQHWRGSPHPCPTPGRLLPGPARDSFLRRDQAGPVAAARRGRPLPPLRRPCCRGARARRVPLRIGGDGDVPGDDGLCCRQPRCPRQDRRRGWGDVRGERVRDAQRVRHGLALRRPAPRLLRPRGDRGCAADVPCGVPHRPPPLQRRPVPLVQGVRGSAHATGGEHLILL